MTFGPITLRPISALWGVCDRSQTGGRWARCLAVCDRCAYLFLFLKYQPTLWYECRNE